MSAGEVGILNVGAGDTKLSFDPSNPAEVKRASTVVADMLKRGFALLVEVGKDEKGPLYRRATGFDPETAEYIVAGAPDALEVPNCQKPASGSAAPPQRPEGRNPHPRSADIRRRCRADCGRLTRSTASPLCAKRCPGLPNIPANGQESRCRSTASAS